MAQDRPDLARRANKIKDRLLVIAAQLAVAGPVTPALVLAVGASCINAVVLDNPKHKLTVEQLAVCAVFILQTEAQLDSGKASWN